MTGANVVRPTAAIYRAATAVIAFVAVARVIGLGTSDFVPAGLMYYTSLSNLLGMAWMLTTLTITIRRASGTGWRNGDASVLPRVGAGIGLALMITMLIYLVVLVPVAFTQGSGYQPFTLTDNLVHIVVPILVMADWVLFARKGALRWVDPLWWAAIPYAYVAFALIRPLFTQAEWPGGGSYPYPFLNVDANGWVGVIVSLLVLSIAIELIAFGIVVVDKVIGRRRDHRL